MSDMMSKIFENTIKQNPQCDDLQYLQTILSYGLTCVFIIAVSFVLVLLKDSGFYGGISIRHQTNAQKDVEKLKIIEARISQLEKFSPKHYPEMKFLTDKDHKRILITGGAGFVGSHLTDRLMVEGHEVTVVDNFFTGRKENIEQWIGHKNFKLIDHDIVNPLDIEVPVDQIYHLVSPDNPDKTIKTNTVGTINVLGLAKRVGARVLTASTIYGDPEVHPQSETDCGGHVNPDEVKRVAENLSYAYAKQENVEVRVARILNTFGPRMRVNEGHVVSSFIHQALQDEPITVCGSGNRTQSFQYVSDLVEGLIMLMNSDCKEPVNLGNPEERSVKEVSSTIKDLIGGNSRILYTDKAEDDGHEGRKPDISSAVKYLNWKPKVSLMDGINETIEYFRKELKKSQSSDVTN